MAAVSDKNTVDMAELAITSDLVVDTGAAPSDAFTLEDVAGVAVVVGMAEGGKCERCWKIMQEVTESQVVCNRCADATADLA